MSIRLKKIAVMCIGATALFGAMNASASSVAVVKLGDIVHTLPQFKSMSHSLESKFSARKSDIEKKAKSLQADIKDYQKNQSILSAKKLSALQDKIKKTNNDLRQMQESFQKDYMTAQQKGMQALVDKVKSAVAVVAKKKHVDVVVTDAVVLYHNVQADITADVVHQLK